MLLFGDSIYKFPDIYPPPFLVLSPSPRCWFSSLLLSQCLHSLGRHLWDLCPKFYHAVSKTHVNRGVAFPRHARKMKNTAKALAVSPGSVSNHLFSWTCDITPTGLDFPISHLGRSLIMCLLHKTMVELLYLQWITNKDLLSSTWNAAQCYVAPWMGVGFGGEWIHAYVWLNPFTVHLKLSQHYNQLNPNTK